MPTSSFKGWPSMVAVTVMVLLPGTRSIGKLFRSPGSALSFAITATGCATAAAFNPDRTKSAAIVCLIMASPRSGLTSRHRYNLPGVADVRVGGGDFAPNYREDLLGDHLSSPPCSAGRKFSEYLTDCALWASPPKPGHPRRGNINPLVLGRDVQMAVFQQVHADDHGGQRDCSGLGEKVVAGKNQCVAWRECPGAIGPVCERPRDFGVEGNGDLRMIGGQAAEGQA